MDPAQSVHAKLVARLKAGDLPASAHDRLPEGLTAPTLVELFQSQVLSRQLDRTARALQARGEGFYTIGSSGHEGMAAVAEAFRPTTWPSSTTVTPPSRSSGQNRFPARRPPGTCC